MKISSVKLNATTSKPSFRANLSSELEYKYKKLGYETLFRYGADSKEYKTYESSIKAIKKYCPDGTLNISKIKDGFSLYLQSPYLKSELVYSTPYKYQLLDLDGLQQTASKLYAINNGFYSGRDFEGPRNLTVEHIQRNIAPSVDRLF